MKKIELDPDMIILTGEEKTELEAVIFEYSENHLSDDDRMKTVVKLSKRLNLSLDFINTIVDNYKNNLPF